MKSHSSRMWIVHLVWIVMLTITLQAQQTVTTTGGTANHVAKFSGTHTIVNSIITEESGRIGIGTTSPTHPLTVNGIIQSESGGIIFPDGTLQKTAAKPGLTSVSHDATLTGAGTGGSPLGIALPLTLTGGASSPAIRANGGASDGIRPAGDGGDFIGGAGAVGVVSTAGSGISGQGGVAADFSGISAGAGGSFTGGSSGVSDVFTPQGGGDGVDAFGGDGTNGGSGGGIGIVAHGGLNPGSGANLAGFFFGDVVVDGNLSKAGGSFKIDHPLDPANKYLYHSFVESPDMMNIYNGNVVTDGSGAAVVTLPEWFETLNRDFRYQLTVIGQFAQAVIESEIANHQFTIKTDKPSVKVSWQVTGIRQDAWANAHRIPVEQDKPEKVRGHYLHPELYDQPATKSVLAAERPDLMRRIH